MKTINKNWFLVTDKKNSECASAKLSELNYGEFYTDTFFAPMYIHVNRKSDDTTHRVFPKNKDVVGVGIHKRKLYWIRKTEA